MNKVLLFFFISIVLWNNNVISSQEAKEQLLDKYCKDKTKKPWSLMKDGITDNNELQLLPNNNSQYLTQEEKCKYRLSEIINL